MSGEDLEDRPTGREDQGQNPWDSIDKKTLWEFYHRKAAFLTHAIEEADKWEDEAVKQAAEVERLRKAPEGPWIIETQRGEIPTVEIVMIEPGKFQVMLSHARVE